MVDTNDQLPPFVRRHLDDVAKRERFTSYEYTHEAGSKPGDGFMAIVRAVQLRGPRRCAETGAVRVETLSLMCKLIPDSVERQKQFHSKVLFEREVHVYASLLPYLAQFQRERGLTDDTGFFAYPQCYVAVADADADEYVIIMRDLRTVGYELWDKVRPMPAENVRMLFEQLGRMNGISLVLRDQCPEKFAELQQMDDLMVRLLDTQSMQEMCGSSFEQAVELIEQPEHKLVLERIRDDWIRVLKGCSNSADPYAVMGHGDSWNNNMMFQGKNVSVYVVCTLLNGSNGCVIPSLQKICVLDWQICRIASPALDISYFFCSSTDKAMRDRHFDELINVYYQNLANVVRHCGSDVERLMPLAEFQNQLKTYGRYGLVMAPLLLQVIVSDPSSVVDMDEAALELSKPEAERKKLEFTKFSEESLAVYRQRLGDVIDDAKKFGWI